MSSVGTRLSGPTAYLDHAASSPLRPEAVAAMAGVQELVFANPSGSHRWSREARRRLDDARDVVADAVGAEPGEVVFTSGGTEADNLALRGVVGAVGGGAVCSAVEHHAVLDTVRALGGGPVAVDRAGRIDRQALALTLAADGVGAVSIVSVMLANNETGVVNDLDEVAETVSRARPGAVLHTDAVAAAAWLDLSKAAEPAALVSLSAHKLGGPKGIGALIVRKGVPLHAMLTGGGQERELRSGTPNVAGAVGFAAALSATVEERDVTMVQVRELRARLRAGIVGALPDVFETVPDDPATERTPNALHLCVPGVDREALLFLLDEAGVAASWGSSCASGASEPSHVLAAMGIPDDLARGSLRLSLGWSTTSAEIDHALRAVPAAVRQLRGAR